MLQISGARRSSLKCEWRHRQPTRWYATPALYQMSRERENTYMWAMSNRFQQDESGPRTPALRPQQPRRRTTEGAAGYFTRHAFSHSYITPDKDPKHYSPDRPRHASHDTWSSDSDSSGKDSENSVEEYSVFPKLQKRLLITLIAVAGSISGLSSNIYFPSQNAIAKVYPLPSQDSVLC